ncbi:MAG: hypothetical protein IKL65_02800 [Bacilli bacterium]|nr:hypothetical protein [Bacilli bacterium]
MAIHCLNPNTVGVQAEEMFNVTSTAGKNLIKSFGTTIENLKNHWKGSDAVANLTDLSKVYTAVTDLVKSLQTIIVSVNNNEVVPLQKHIVASGGSCTVGNELAPTLGEIESVIAVPTDAVESWTDPAIIADAEAFTNFPTTFENFVNELNETKDNLLNNWLDGTNRAEVVSTFEKFNNNVADYKSQITKVRDNLNIVAENKKQLM